jgi:large subunit ribosomal protein L18
MIDKIKRRIRRKKGIRKKISGNSAKPRITVFKSNRHLYVQAVDDITGTTLCACSDSSTDAKRNKEGASQVGLELAKDLKKKKIAEGVFDRNGYLYHGLVQAVADGIRKGGIKL